MRLRVFLVVVAALSTSLTSPNLFRLTWTILPASASAGERTFANASTDNQPKPDAPPVATRKPVRQGRYFNTLPTGVALPSDAQCAAAVKPRPETMGINTPYNTKRGSQRLAKNFFSSSDPLANTRIASRVTGNFVGSTDEILQWVACKWGIDEDIVRAQVAVESKWKQVNIGDWHSNPNRCPPGHAPGADGREGVCPESWGLMQVKYRFFSSAWPSAKQSTAFNVDTAYAVWRACYEGYETWLNDVDRGQDYAAGDLWGCIGRWYSGRWYTPAAIKYINEVQQRLAVRLWEQQSFQQP
ncbi:MAG: hypothetical protein M1546_25505 [Chloroflexi bacterium]|nr:hypothetical protein [Chloroflexota bacterium]